MLRLLDRGTRLCDGITRREMLRAGGVGLGALSLGSLLAARESLGAGTGSFGKAKSVILFGLTGGAPQHETWDPKPDAPGLPGNDSNSRHDAPPPGFGKPATARRTIGC